MKSMKKIIGKLKINEKYKGIVIGFALAFLLLACVGVTYSWFGALTEGEGYKYTSGSQYGLDIHSAIKTHLDSWYTSNLNSDSTVDTSGSSSFDYGASIRLETNKASTYVCSQLNDRFTTSTTTGNGTTAGPYKVKINENCISAEN